MRDKHVDDVSRALHVHRYIHTYMDSLVPRPFSGPGDEANIWNDKLNLLSKGPSFGTKFGGIVVVHRLGFCRQLKKY